MRQSEFLSTQTAEEVPLHLEYLKDRCEAGRLLAPRLVAYRDRSDCVVVGLARGGVPVAHEIASALHLPLDICIVRKLVCPFQPELAIGALGPEALVVWNEDLVHELRISQEELEVIIRKSAPKFSGAKRLTGRAGLAFPSPAKRSFWWMTGLRQAPRRLLEFRPCAASPSSVSSSRSA
jgi:hypothetical protein